MILAQPVTSDAQFGAPPSALDWLALERLFDYRDGMMRVDLSRRPYQAHLRMLGDGADGRQWALITWTQRVSADGEAQTVPYAAWVPAGQLTQPTWMEREPLRVVKLPADPARWPCLAQWDGIYAGPWPDGDLPSPDGVEVLAG